jgi:hypothetical protein
MKATWEGLRAVRELGQITDPCLGPAGSLTLILPGTAGGPPSVTGLGKTVLSSVLSRLPDQHPATRIVTSSSSSLHKMAGCGGSTLVSMIAGALRKIEDMSSGTDGQRALMRIRLAVAREGRRILHEVVMPCVEDLLLYPEVDEVREASSAVLHTAMAGKISIRWAVFYVK